MSGAASSSTMPRLQVLPQKSVNHRPMMALFSCSLLIRNLSFVPCGSHQLRSMTHAKDYSEIRQHKLRFLPRYRNSSPRTVATTGPLAETGGSTCPEGSLLSSDARIGVRV